MQKVQHPKWAAILVAAMCTAVPSQCAAQATASQPQIAFTWDDLPAHSSLPQGETRVEIGQHIVAAMKSAHMPPVYGFVNGAQTEREPLSTPMLANWRAAGLLLGNHTWSHMNLNSNPAEAWEADLLRNEPLLQKETGSADWHWLRYPFLAEGDTPAKRDEVRAFLAKHGYHIAGVTMSFADYSWNEPYARCVAKHDDASIERLEDSYLAAADASASATRREAKALFGHDIPYVLLMHVGAFDARMLPRLLALYRERGFGFVTLQQAESDPFYKVDTDPSLPWRPDTLDGAMYSRHMKPPAAARPVVDLDTVCR